MLTEAFQKYQSNLQVNLQAEGNVNGVEGDLSIHGARMFEYGLHPPPY